MNKSILFLGGLGIGGGALIAHAAHRKDLFGVAVGIGLLTRGLTNLEIQDLLGLKDSRGDFRSKDPDRQRASQKSP